jgi:hypothetical protein
LSGEEALAIKVKKGPVLYDHDLTAFGWAVKFSIGLQLFDTLRCLALLKEKKADISLVIWFMEK